MVCREPSLRLGPPGFHTSLLRAPLAHLSIISLIRSARLSGLDPCDYLWDGRRVCERRWRVNLTRTTLPMVTGPCGRCEQLKEASLDTTATSMGSLSGAISDASKSIKKKAVPPYYSCLMAAIFSYAEPVALAASSLGYLVIMQMLHLTLPLIEKPFPICGVEPICNPG